MDAVYVGMGVGLWLATVLMVRALAQLEGPQGERP